MCMWDLAQGTCGTSGLELQSTVQNLEPFECRFLGSVKGKKTFFANNSPDNGSTTMPFAVFDLWGVPEESPAQGPSS